jgi:hypothetical protein
MRDCHPAPVDLKYSTTSRLYLTDTSNFRLSDFGRPRTDFIGTIDLSCFSDSGCASGSAFAAARILRSSAAVGTLIFGTLDTFDIVIHLASCSATKTDNPPTVASLDERDVVKHVSFWHQGNHPHFVVAEAVIHPDEGGIPVQFARYGQRNAVSGAVERILRRIKLDSHALL